MATQRANRGTKLAQDKADRTQAWTDMALHMAQAAAANAAASMYHQITDPLLKPSPGSYMYYFWHGNENPVDGWDHFLNITQSTAKTVAVGVGSTLLMCFVPETVSWQLYVLLLARQ